MIAGTNHGITRQSNSIKLYNNAKNAYFGVRDSATGFVQISGANVGIGTTSPGSLLDVKGTVNLQSGHNEGIIIGAENNSTARNDNTIKVARVGMPQYDID